jgi:hypothetical protein
MSGSAPQFPDPLGSREVYRPGAVAHKAGRDVVRRVESLEIGALGIPGPGVTNGSLPYADDTAHGNTTWKLPHAPTWSTIAQQSGRLGGGTPVATYACLGGAVNTSPIETYGTFLGPHFNLDAADYAITGRTTQFRIHVSYGTNATAAGASCVFDFGLSAISAFGGASGTSVTAAFSSSIYQNAASVTNPPASGGGPLNSTAFSTLAQAAYVFVVKLSGATMAANSGMTFTIQLQVRHT